MPSKRTTLACEHCGSPFTRNAAQIAAGAYRHCSRSCRGNAHRRPLAERFWEKVRKSTEPDGCWLWTAAKMRGYGQIGTGTHQASDLAHRVAWTLATGAPVPPTLTILHTCDERACVRNDDDGIYVVRGVVLPRRGHLALGTRLDNNRDMADKGAALRAALVGIQHPDGVRRGAAKLTGLDRLAIEHLVAAGMPARYIVQRFGITDEALGQILHR